MTEYFNDTNQIDSYMKYPRFLQKMDLKPIVKIVYMLLLDRARLSLKNKRNWTDPNGRIYINYTIDSLAEDIGRSPTTAKNCLNDLKAVDLIETKQVGINEPNMIYVKIPINDESNDSGRTENRPSGQAEKCLSGGVVYLPSSGQKSVYPADRKLSASNSTSSKNAFNKHGMNKNASSIRDNSSDLSSDTFFDRYFLPLSSKEWNQLQVIYPDHAFKIYQTAHARARDSHTVQSYDYVLQVAEELFSSNDAYR